MSFLAPLFLASLAALAVPVIIHLVQRERREVVAFPSLMFLRRIPYRSERRRRVRHWLLLAMRCMAVALIAAAFARPLLQRSGAAGLSEGGSAREVVILLDRSYSMGYGDRWARAKATAGKALAGLRAGDRASLVLFDDDATAVTEPTEDVALLRAAIDSVSPGSGITRFAPALRLAGRILSESRFPSREVILISDFQRAGWRVTAAGDTKLPPGVTLTPVEIGDSTDANVAVTAVELHRSFGRGREQIIVAARLANAGSFTVSREVALELDGRKIGSRQVAIPAGGAASISFEPFPLGEATIRGSVRAEADALLADDARHFVVSRGENVSVLLLSGRGGSSRGVHITSALGIGSQPVFRLDRRRGSGTVTAADLAAKGVVIMDDVASSKAAERALEEFVQKGGGLIIATGEGAGSWTNGSALLPGSVGGVVDRPLGDGGIVSELDHSHQVFKQFATPRSGDFATARFLRYRKIEPAADSRVIARFDDGAPALVERSHGDGRILLWSSTLDPYWNDLALQPVYLPFVHEMVKYVSGYAERAAAFPVGSVIQLDQLGGGSELPQSDGGLAIVSPTGARERVARDGAIRIREPGFYEIRPASRPLATPLVAAGNVDPAESDLTVMDAREIVAAVTSDTQLLTSATATQDLTAADREKSQGLWRYLLLAALFLLAIESVLSNHLSRPRGVGVARS
ncbi:MAG: BatA domain-containing protein [Gemmatimonadaceae bacterium]